MIFFKINFVFVVPVFFLSFYPNKSSKAIARGDLIKKTSAVKLTNSFSLDAIIHWWGIISYFQKNINIEIL